MVKVNRKLEYALIALKHMWGKYPGALTSAKEIADAYGSPFDATARSLQIMANRGLLKSEQGAYGGYQIIKDLHKVTLFDLIEMILGPVEIAKCLQSDGHSCELETSCNIRSPVATLNGKLNEFFKNITLIEVLGSPGNGSKKGPAQDGQRVAQ